MTSETNQVDEGQAVAARHLQHHPRHHQAERPALYQTVLLPPTVGVRQVEPFGVIQDSKKDITR